MNREKYLQVVYYIYIYLQGLLLILFSKNIFSDKFFYDAGTIKYFFIKTNYYSFELFDSYGNTARFYKIIGLSRVESDILIGMINFSVIMLFLFFVFKALNVNINLIQAVFISLWMIPITIYTGQLSKDFIVFMITSLITIIVIKFKNNTSLLLSSIIIIFYALFFRVYWFIYLYIFLVSYLVFIKWTTTKIKKITMFCLFILLLFFISSVFGVYLTDSRVGVNAHRLGSEDARTMIINPLVNNHFLDDFLNWLSAIYSMYIPIFTIWKKNIFNIAYVVFNIVTICFVYKNYKEYNQNNHMFLLVACLYFSMLTTQALFEPDIGSTLRHQCVFLPFLYVLLTMRKKF